MVLGHDCSGRDLLLAGQFASSRSHFEQVLALHDPIAHGSLVNQTGSHPHAISQGYLAIALFCLGYPDQALVQSNAAVAEARRLAHPPTLTVTLSTDSRLLCLAGDNAGLEQRASELVDVATEQGFPLYRTLGTIYRGWVKVSAGDVSAGLSLLRNSSNAYSATGAKTRIPYHIALLAKACEIAGQVEEALFLLDDALKIAEAISERWFASELYRHKGQLVLRQGNQKQPSNSIGKPWPWPRCRRPNSGSCAPPPVSPALCDQGGFRSPQRARSRPWLVRRGFRHTRPHGSQDTARARLALSANWRRRVGRIVKRASCLG